MTLAPRRMRALVWPWLLGSLWVATMAAAAQDTAAPLSTVDAGRKLYTVSCARCHGINLVTSGGSFFDLRTLRTEDRERFLRSVAKGLRAMPAWEGTLKGPDFDALWSYIGSVNGWSAGTVGQASAVETSAVK